MHAFYITMRLRSHWERHAKQVQSVYDVTRACHPRGHARKDSWKVTRAQGPQRVTKRSRGDNRWDTMNLPLGPTRPQITNSAFRLPFQLGQPFFPSLLLPVARLKYTFVRNAILSSSPLPPFPLIYHGDNGVIMPAVR